MRRLCFSLIFTLTLRFENVKRLRWEELLQEIEMNYLIHGFYLADLLAIRSEESTTSTLNNETPLFSGNRDFECINKTELFSWRWLLFRKDFIFTIVYFWIKLADGRSYFYENRMDRSRKSWFLINTHKILLKSFLMLLLVFWMSWQCECAFYEDL